MDTEATNWCNNVRLEKKFDPTVVTTLVGVLRKGFSIWAAVARMRRRT